MKALAFLLTIVPASAAMAETLRPFDASSWATIRREHAGRPTLVHFWGMTCAPCRVEMPKLGAFIVAHPNLDAVTIDTDPVVRSTGSPTNFLQETAMPLTDAWQFSDAFAEKLYFSVDPAWQGEVPMTILIDKNGRQIEKIGAVEPLELGKWLAEQHR